MRGLDALAERLAAAGADVSWDHAFRHDRCYAVDPFGNHLAFLEPHRAG